MKAYHSSRFTRVCVTLLVLHHERLHVGCLDFSALFVCSSIQPVLLGAADAQQLPAFVELKPLADMRVLNSAPASRGVPLHGSHEACGTLSLSFPHTFSLSIFLISFLPASLYSSPLFSRSPVISAPAVDPTAHAGPRGTRLFPPALVRERGVRL